MGLYEERVQRLHDHVVKHEKKAEDATGTGELTNKQIMSILDEKGVEYDKKANKTALLELLESVSGNQDKSEGAE